VGEARTTWKNLHKLEATYLAPSSRWVEAALRLRFSIMKQRGLHSRSHLWRPGTRSGHAQLNECAGTQTVTRQRAPHAHHRLAG
jgi:hypothetical protein